MTDNKKIRLVAVPHSHWDREWYLPFEAFRHRLVKMMDGLMDLLENEPRIASFHLDGQTIVVGDYEEVAGRSERLRGLIRTGRIRIGPWYVLPDEFLVSGEALVRNLERGMADCRALSADPRTCYLPDMFGHIAQAPQVMKGFGLESAVLWRGMTPDIEGPEFLWRAPDGSAVFALFLPMGYGIAANLPENPALFIERMESILDQLGRPEGPVLLLCGGDHVEARAYLAEVMEKAGEARGWEFEFGDLDGFVSSRMERAADLDIHCGELHFSGRAPILPGVASSRLYLKKLDFEADSALVRYAEPLCGLLSALGGPDRRSFLDYGWSLLLENHPHDSICGCSVDPVHREMETRYEKAKEVCDRLMCEGMSAAMRRLVPLEASGKTAAGLSLAVMNPAGARRECVLTGEVEGRLRHAMAVETQGAERPLQVLETVEPERVLLDATLDREPALVLAGELVCRELFGFYLHRARVTQKKYGLEIRLDAGRLPSAADAQAAREEVEKALADPGVKKVRFRVNRLSRQRVAAVIAELPGHCVKSFRLVKRKARHKAGVEAGQERMENDLVRLQFEPGGTALLTDKASGIGYRCLRFLDAGDRGDTYNFDPLPGDEPVCEPEKVSLKTAASGPVAAVVEVRHRFRIPQSIGAGRARRSRKRVCLDLATTVTMYSGCSRVDFKTVFTNPAKDHRLQVAIRAPFCTDSVKVLSSYCLVDRPIRRMQRPAPPAAGNLAKQLLGTEGPYGTGPQKNLAAITNGERGIAVMNRGMAELDALKLEAATRISMTMARSVGWLSRPDLYMRPGNAGPSLPTPEAQCLREFIWEYALMPFADTGEYGRLVADAHAFSYPPFMSFVQGESAEGRDTLSIIEVDNPLVQAESVRPVEGGGIEVRLVNYSNKEQGFTLKWGPWWKGAVVTDLSGVPLHESRPCSERLTRRLRPCGIMTIRLSGPGSEA